MSFLNIILTYIILPYWSLVLTLFALSAYLPPQFAYISQLSAFGARSLSFIAGVITCAIYGMLASLVLRVVGLAGLGQWTTARAFKWLMWPILGVWFDIDEESRRRLDGTRPGVFLGNHQTELDILFLGHIWPKYTSVTAKSDLKWYPFLGQFMTLSNTVFIDRANKKQAISTFNSAASHMTTARQSVFIFPEGTRSYSSKPDLLPFKKGAFHLAVQAQVPIIPVVSANYSHVFNFQAKRFNKGVIPVKVLEPIETKGLKAEDVEDLVRKVREDMLVALKELYVKTGGGSITNGGVAPELRQRGKIAMSS